MTSIILLLLVWSCKIFGVSSNLSTVCSMMRAGKRVSFFDFNWKVQQWNLFVSPGVIISSFVASNFIAKTRAEDISQNIVDQLVARCIDDTRKKFSTPTPFLKRCFYKPIHFSFTCNLKFSGKLWSAICWWLNHWISPLRIVQHATSIINRCNWVFYWRSIGQSFYYTNTP